MTRMDLRGEFDDSEPPIPRYSPSARNGPLQIDINFVWKVLGYVVAALVTYGAVTARVSVLESKQGDTERRLQRIEDKVDVLVQRP